MVMMRCAILWLFLLMMVLFVSFAIGKPTVGAKDNKNHALLTKLGMQKVRAPNSHHRKRLAVESRHHSRSDDSQMFIIKLPPNPHYYNSPNSIHHNIHNNHKEVGKNIPVGFKSNGKPGKIYHWNIPVIKKMVSSKYKSRLNDFDDDIDFQNPESWNEVLDKPEKDRKPMKPAYYVPVKNKKSSFMKYFPGNGKPHSFYVIEKSKKAHYHRLLP